MDLMAWFRGNRSLAALARCLKQSSSTSTSLRWGGTFLYCPHLIVQVCDVRILACAGPLVESVNLAHAAELGDRVEILRGDLV